MLPPQDFLLRVRRGGGSCHRQRQFHERRTRRQPGSRRHAKGVAADPFFAQVRDQLEAYAYLQLPITPELARSYRRQAKAAANKPRARNPILPDDRRAWERMNSPLATMEWKDFVEEARRDLYHDFRRRMKLMRAIQQIFFRTPSFAKLTVAEAKGIAGVLGRDEAKKEGLADID